MLEIQNISKTYNKKIKAVDNASLHLEMGKITAILGPNASGKSTLIKMLLGLVRPSIGNILWKGKSILSQSYYREEIGYMPQIQRFPENLTVQELIEYIASLRKCKDFDYDLIHEFDLKKFWKCPIGSLSGGTRQKLNASLAFLFNPALLILDEPSVGMDTLSSVQLKNKVRLEKQKGKTILITSHILSEVEELADNLVFILEGKITYTGSIETLLTQSQSYSLEKAIIFLLQTSKIKPLEKN